MRRERNKHDPAIELLALCLFAKKMGRKGGKTYKTAT
jgi:hypothetical protein